MVLRTLIVDDEAIARRVLREEPEEIDNAHIVGEAEDGSSALIAIHDLSPDLVFLDLQMPGISGFSVILYFAAHGNATIPFQPREEARQRLGCSIR